MVELTRWTQDGDVWTLRAHLFWDEDPVALVSIKSYKDPATRRDIYYGKFADLRSLSKDLPVPTKDNYSFTGDAICLEEITDFAEMTLRERIEEDIEDLCSIKRLLK